MIKRYQSKSLRHHLTMVMYAMAAVVGMECVALSAIASTQGFTGVTSQGAISLSLHKASMVRISNLSDMLVNWTDTDGDVVWRNDICVYSTRGNGGYTVTATGASNDDGAFVMRNGENTVPYNITWNDGGGGNLSDEGIALLPGVPSGMLSHASTDNSSCSGGTPGPTARLLITIPRSNIEAVHDGNYSETLTLLLAPN